MLFEAYSAHMFYPIQTPSQLSTHLRALRLAKQWTQAQLAAKLGLSQTRVARIEKDPLSISAEQLLRVLAALDASIVLQTSDNAAAQTLGVAEPGSTGTAPLKTGPTDNW